jgi:hypothetical protein
MPSLSLSLLHLYSPSSHARIHMAGILLTYRGVIQHVIQSEPFASDPNCFYQFVEGPIQKAILELEQYLPFRLSAVDELMVGASLALWFYLCFLLLARESPRSRWKQAIYLFHRMVHLFGQRMATSLINCWLPHVGKRNATSSIVH